MAHELGETGLHSNYNKYGTRKKKRFDTIKPWLYLLQLQGL